MHLPDRRTERIVLSVAVVVFLVSAALALGVAAWDAMLGPCACSILQP